MGLDGDGQGHGYGPRRGAARLFEPFFTTKEVGKGTGLGLSTVHGIVEQSGGKITVEKFARSGREVLCVPASGRGAGGSADRTAWRRPLNPKRGGAVMVVEDEDALRKLVSSIVSAAGYQVTVACNGDEALSMAAAKRIDLLLTDVVMPGASGPELAARLRTKQEDLRIIYMSGYDRDLVQQEVLDGRATLLPKPFTPRGLLTRIDEVLRAKPERVNAAAIRRHAGAHYVIFSDNSGMWWHISATGLNTEFRYPDRRPVGKIQFDVCRFNTANPSLRSAVGASAQDHR